MNNFYGYSGTSLYGNYRTRSFTDIYSNETDFINDWNSTPFSKNLSIDMSLVFYLLYARYGNSHIASSDENQFRYHLFSIVFQYGPTWSKELEVQADVRALSLEDLQLGSTNIINSAANPGTAPSTQTLEELQYIDQQNVTKNKRSKVDGYALLLSLLKDDVTEQFIKRFQKLFLTIVEPERPLWYVDYPEGGNN